MFNLPKLNLPAVELRAKRDGDNILIWDSVRSKWLVLTPEEWVRQHWLGWLQNHCGVLPALIATEHSVEINGQSQRADIVVYGANGVPSAIVECKSVDVNVDGDVFAQAARYNAVIKAKYLIISNGMTHYCFEQQGDQYVKLTSIPKL